MKIKKYLRLIYIKIRTSTIYKAEYYANLVNILSMLLLNVLLWYALYSNQDIGSGQQFKMMITYITLSIILQTVFLMEETVIQNKIRDGSIFYELFRPLSFRLNIFFSAVGKLIFNILLIFLPALVIIWFFVHLLLPVSLLHFFYFLASLVLGYIVLYNLNFIIWILSFEHLVIFGYLEIKNAIITIFSGALVPIWFMPDQFVAVINILPFKYIYYVPLAIYLGIIPENEIYMSFLIQLAWASVFFITGHILWKWAVKKAVIQGG